MKALKVETRFEINWKVIHWCELVIIDETIIEKPVELCVGIPNVYFRQKIYVPNHLGFDITIDHYYDEQGQDMGSYTYLERGENYSFTMESSY